MPRKDDIRFDRRAVVVEHQSARGEVVRNVGAFTRGSQLIRLRYMMMMEGLRWPIVAALASFSLFLVLLLAFLMREHEVQLVEMRIFAGFWSLVDLDPTHVVNLTLPDNTLVPMAIGDVPDYPDVAWAWTKFLRCIVVALGAAGFLTSPLATWFVKLSQQIGTDILKERHERGAMLLPSDVLAREISAHNDAEFRTELAASHPDLDPASVAALLIPARTALGIHVPYTMAGVPYPWRLEAKPTIRTKALFQRPKPSMSRRNSAWCRCARLIWRSGWALRTWIRRLPIPSAISRANGWTCIPARHRTN